MEFKAYQHICRFGDPRTEGIQVGTCFIFPKIDGTNSSVWLDEEGNVRTGKRRGTCTPQKDNAGFSRYISKDERIAAYLKAHPNHRLYGEWLVPHTIQDYRNSAWRKFYVFDVCVDVEDSDEVAYLPFPEYSAYLEEFGIDYISPICIVENPSEDFLVKCLEKNTFLMQDGKGPGEGIVIKNYDYRNMSNQIIWAKMVRAEFKEAHLKGMGVPKISCTTSEAELVDRFVTKAFVDKEHAKFVNEKGDWQMKYMGDFLNHVFYELVAEEILPIVTGPNKPSINFRNLYLFTVNKIKDHRPDIFKKEK